MTNYQPSSIGQIGTPYFDSHNMRVKGFCSYVIGDTSEKAEEFIHRAKHLRDATSATRITVRLVTTQPFRTMGHELKPIYGAMKPASARNLLPVDYINGFETRATPLVGKWMGHWIQYWGENAADRIEPEGIRLKEVAIVSDSLKARKLRNPFSKAGERGYMVELGVRSDADIRQLHELYNAVYEDYVFPLTPDNVAGLVTSQSSVTALARDGTGNIASVAVAEIVEIPTDKGLLRISEISDEATHPNHRGNGLNQACVAILAQELLRRYGDEIHLIYVEDRATSRAVNQQSANLGFLHVGRLNRHGRLKADRDIDVEGPYEDLNVWFLPR